MEDYNVKNSNYGSTTEEYTSESVTQYISKKVVTQGGTTDVTFKGNQVIDYSITPEGVAKASINTTKGVVTFEKYDPEWCGEVTLSLETQQGNDDSQHFVHDFSINFENYGDQDVQWLSSDEEDSTIGGTVPHKHVWDWKNAEPLPGSNDGRVIVRCKVKNCTATKIARIVKGGMPGGLDAGSIRNARKAATMMKNKKSNK